MYSRSGHVGHGCVEIAKAVLHREGPADDVAVAEIIGHGRQGRQLCLMTRNLSGDGILVALEIHHRVGLCVRALPVGKDEVAGDVVSRRQGDEGHAVLERDCAARLRGDKRIEQIWYRRR